MFCDDNVEVEGGDLGQVEVAEAGPAKKPRVEGEQELDEVETSTAPESGLKEMVEVVPQAVSKMDTKQDKPLDKLASPEWEDGELSLSLSESEDETLENDNCEQTKATISELQNTEPLVSNSPAAVSEDTGNNFQEKIQDKTSKGSVQRSDANNGGCRELAKLLPNYQEQFRTCPPPPVLPKSDRKRKFIQPMPYHPSNFSYRQTPYPPVEDAFFKVKYLFTICKSHSIHFFTFAPNFIAFYLSKLPPGVESVSQWSYGRF